MARFTLTRRLMNLLLASLSWDWLAFAADLRRARFELSGVLAEDGTLLPSSADFLRLKSFMA